MPYRIAGFGGHVENLRIKNIDMKKTEVLPQKFSEYFGLKLNQDEIEFLDIYANEDIPLFLDPYGISAMESKWSKKCEEQIATYFQYILDSIKNGDKKTKQRLLNALHEVDEVALGYSSGIPSGRGIGVKQAKQILDAFESSEAAKSGDIRDIADCALLIPGISRDKISDITSNILKSQLILFTQRMCKKYSIPTKRVAINNVFDYKTFTFKSYYDKLPIINNRAKILLPINSVRQDPELSKDKYYRNFVLEFLRAEHSHAGDSLSTVLKNGNVVVRISDLKNQYPKNTDFLYNFSKENPQILEKYKSELRKTAVKKGSKATLKPKKKVLTAKERIRILMDIKPGNEDATNFHKISYNSLIYIFGNRLSKPNREREINDGRKRIDIIFNNNNKDGFFKNLNSLHQIKCPKIIIECKNYGREIGNPEIDQLQARLNKKRGMFGILLCRSIENKSRMLQRCKDVLNDEKGYIIVLNDSDLSKLMLLKDDGNETGIDEFMTNKIDELIM